MDLETKTMIWKVEGLERTTHRFYRSESDFLGRSFELQFAYHRAFYQAKNL